MTTAFPSIPARVAAAACLAVLASTAHAQYSTPVRDVENPARAPFMYTDDVDLTNFSSVLFSLLGVPAGRRLVVEHVSVSCRQESGPFTTAQLRVIFGQGAAAKTIPIEIPLQYQGQQRSDHRYYSVGSLATRLYVEPGTTIYGFAARGETGSGAATCDFSVSGYTVAV